MSKKHAPTTSADWLKMLNDSTLYRHDTLTLCAEVMGAALEAIETTPN